MSPKLLSFSILIAVLLNSVYSIPLNSTNNKVCHDIKSCLAKAVSFGSNPTPAQLCDICYVAMPLVRELIHKNNFKHLKDIVKLACIILKIVDEEVCFQAIDLFEVPVLNIINDTTLTNRELCSAGIGCGPITNPILNWNITLPSTPKPAVIKPAKPNPSSPKIRILQMSDIHIDFEYQVGALAACDQPLCCRNSSTSKLNSKTAGNLAGVWGDYRNCDVPLRTVENMFDYISKNEEFDFVYWTGDLPPHNVWDQTKDDQLNALDILTALFKKYFSKKAIFPTLGNHEASPVNLFPTPYNKEDNISWLYTRLADDWTQTGLPAYLAANISSGAFYTLPMFPGLRLVSLNMNYCPSDNYYLYVNSTDPLGQLAWLVNILQESENIGEKVHLIGHIHPSSCLDSFSANYYRIVNRYESTIVGQFFGHQHSEGFNIFYDLDNLTRPISVAYVSGSVTTYSYLNPSYRVFTVDGFYENSSFQVLDHETYFMNLTDANLSLKPVWQKEYSALDDFNLPSLSPEDWDKLINYMLKDLNGPLVDKLYKYHVKSADGQKSCDLNCRRQFVCNFKQARSDRFIPC